MSIMRELNERPIAYYPIYRKLTGSTTAGILLSQLMYWFSKKDTFFKTDADLIDETMLSTDELKSAKSKIKKLDFITIERRGIPCKTYYVISWEKYEDTLREYHLLNSDNASNSTEEEPQTSMCKSHNTVGGNPTNCTVENPITYNVKSLTKTTTKTTTKNKKNIKKDFSFSLSQSTQLENTSQEYQDKLKAYAVVKDGAYSYESFLNHHLAKGSKFKDWSRAYNTWMSNTQKFQNIDTTKCSDKLEHPKYGFVYREYGSNKVYHAESLQIVGEVNITRTAAPEKQEAQSNQSRDVMSGLSNLAQGKRI